MTIQIELEHVKQPRGNIAHVSSVSGVTSLKSEETCIVTLYSNKSCVIHDVAENEALLDAEYRVLERMWDAYNAQAGGYAFDGKPLPTFNQLSDDRKQCWLAALRAI